MLHTDTTHRGREIKSDKLVVARPCSKLAWSHQRLQNWGQLLPLPMTGRGKGAGEWGEGGIDSSPSTMIKHPNDMELKCMGCLHITCHMPSRVFLVKNLSSQLTHWELT